MTYRRLIDERGLPFDADLVKEIDVAARMFQDGPFDPYPGVVEALSELQSHPHDLFLVTAARQAERFQNRKIDQSGLRHFFDRRIFITGSDKTERYRRLILGAEVRGVVVGDSSKHDIGPGKSVGAWTIKIGHNGWSATHADVVPDFTADHFSEVTTIIASLPS